MTEIKKIIERIKEGKDDYAIYKYPEENRINIILSEKSRIVNNDNLSEKHSGFIFYPFDKEKHPKIILGNDFFCSSDSDEMEKIFKPVSEERPFKIDKEENGKKRYKEDFDEILSLLHSGRLKKAVLSRTKKLYCDTMPDPIRIFMDAAGKYDNCFVYLFSSALCGTWLGCSPEVMIRGNKTLTTTALAGTQTYSPGLIWDKKNKDEQEYVSGYIREVLYRNGINFSETENYTMKAGQLAHIKKDFIFSAENKCDFRTLLEDLFPTPAICGVPQKEAWDLIKRHHPDREYYSGIVGTLGADSSVNLYVNLRCMKMEDHIITLFAGGGILESSVFEEEWSETEKKISMIRTLLECRQIKETSQKL